MDEASQTSADIARLEDEIERLSDSLARCRKIAIAAQLAVGIGAVWLLVLLSGLIGRDAVSLLGSTASILGGIVVYGSNATTARQFGERIAAAEQSRAELISGLDLREVERPPLLH